MKYFRNDNFLKECLDNKVSVNSLDKAGNTALHWVIYLSKSNISQKNFLLKFIKIKAAYGGHMECVNLLINNPNVLLDIQVT
jgi:hypothetical protein